jgi:hypothetical protein
MLCTGVVGTSSAAQQPQVDWPDLLSICEENNEFDKKFAGAAPALMASSPAAVNP